ncbi:MAG: M20 family metallopeptidase [Phycisphaeraceae bacterium]
MTTLPPPDDVVSLLQQMVRQDTVNTTASGRRHPEQPLSQHLESLAQAWGLQTRRLPVHTPTPPEQGDNLLVTYEADRSLPWLMFDSHLDTVSVAGMTIDPFSGEVRDGKLFGRGSCDTKGTGAAMLWALRQYAAGTHHPRNIALLFSVDEEIGMTGVASFLTHDLPALGFRPEGVIVGEPTELHPVVAHNGTLRWKLIAHGKAAHSSVPHEGRSAIAMMLHAIDAIDRQYIARLSAEHPLTGPAVCSINVIQGGTAVNIIPDRCQVQIDRRLVPGETAEPVMPEVLRLAGESLPDAGDGYLDDLPDPPFTQEKLVYHPPLTDATNGDLLALAKAVLKQMGLPTLHLGAPFGTHAGFFSQAGVPAIVLGPGDSARAHQASEWLDLDQLHKGVALYHGLMTAEPG